MKCFIEWLMLEVGTSPINWKVRNKGTWTGFFDIDGIAFELGFWDWNGRGSWQVQFYQIKDGVNNFDDPSNLGFSQLIQLFQTIDDALVNLVQSGVPVQQISIHPEAISDKRRSIVDKRYKKPGDDAWTKFDLAKFNAYSQMFQYSKLKSLGYDMQPEGEKLIIRPTQQMAA